MTDLLPPTPTSHPDPAPTDRVRKLIGLETAVTAGLGSQIPRELRGILDAQDVWQHTCLDALESIDTIEWRGEARFRRWVMVIAERRLRMMVRHHLGSDYVRPMPLLIDDLAAMLVTTSTGPSTAAQRRDEVNRVMRAIATLSTVQRSVLTLDLVHLMTHDEIAEKLEMTPAAVRKAHFRALAAVRKVLGGPAAAEGTAASP